MNRGKKRFFPEVNNLIKESAKLISQYCLKISHVVETVNFVFFEYDFQNWPIGYSNPKASPIYLYVNKLLQFLLNPHEHLKVGGAYPRIFKSHFYF